MTKETFEHIIETENGFISSSEGTNRVSRESSEGTSRVSREAFGGLYNPRGLPGATE